MVEVDGEAVGANALDFEDFEDGMGFAFHDLEGAATTVYAATVATRRVVSVVVVDLAVVVERAAQSHFAKILPTLLSAAFIAISSSAVNCTEDFLTAALPRNATPTVLSLAFS